ncbi:serine threonine- phosphatase CPPED1 [Pelobates cultripes]|uniref:Serine threonine- phosphatase CPPED1 n=1 Tax=Pelobates cultripes TaxID=61616 RepID=A0AAD1WDR6_PELCU|nr:serine threonine- phosphatase CPPED1 [Pelobates cultripes]
MCEDREVFLRAQGRIFTAFREDEESQWKGPFYFIQGADPQFGLMKSWEIGECDYGGDEWEKEIRLTEEAVQAINKLSPKPKFFVLCGDLVHSMPGNMLKRIAGPCSVNFGGVAFIIYHVSVQTTNPYLTGPVPDGPKFMQKRSTSLWSSPPPLDSRPSFPISYLLLQRCNRLTQLLCSDPAEPPDYTPRLLFVFL